MALSRPVICGPKSENDRAGLNLQENNDQKLLIRTVPLPNNYSDNNNYGKIMLQPRLCNLRAYGSDRVGIMIKKIKIKNNNNNTGIGVGEDEVSPFFATLAEYIESSKKSQDYEIIFGRLAMIVFAATVTMELVTGNSLFRKMELEGIAEAAGVCVGAVAFAAIFAWFSSARNKVGRIFTVNCSTFIDSLIDQIVDGLFYEEPSDWSDDI